MERVSILCEGPVVGLEDLPPKILNAVGDIAGLPDAEPAAERGAGEAPDAGPLDVRAILTGAGSAPAGPPVSGTPGSFFGFIWPTLEVLEQKGMDLKMFLDSVEERLLAEALQRADGVKNQAAEILGIKRTTLIEKLKKRGME